VSKTALQEGFDITQCIELGGTCMYFIITDHGMMPESEYLAERMRDMNLEADASPADVEFAYPPTATPLAGAVRLFENGFIEGDSEPEAATIDGYRHFCSLANGKVKDALEAARIALTDFPSSELADPHIPLTLDEAGAIWMYTLQTPRIYAILNRRLRSRARTLPTIEPWMPFLALIDRGCSKLKPRPKEEIFYRGMETKPERFEVKYEPRPGKQIAWYGLGSASTCRIKALHFCGNSGNGVLIKITNTCAYSIKRFSRMPNECEVLFLPNTPFHPTDIRLDPHDKIIVAVLEQLPRHPPTTAATQKKEQPTKHP
jgi:hypothetical protein